MLILNVINNDLACDCAVSRVLIMTYHRFARLFSLKMGCTNSVLYLVYSNY